MSYYVSKPAKAADATPEQKEELNRQYLAELSEQIIFSLNDIDRRLSKLESKEG